MPEPRTWRVLGADGRRHDSPVPGTLGGHRARRLYGRLDCRAALAALARGGYVKERVFFLDEPSAVAAGYRPCAVCMPREYAAWKAAATGSRIRPRIRHDRRPGPPGPGAWGPDRAPRRHAARNDPHPEIPMDRPRILMHMMTSIDGRIVTTRWPKSFDFGEVYERVHRDLAGDAWLVGPSTMAEFAQGAPVPVAARDALPRTTWKAPAAAHGPYAVALDRNGRLHLNVDRVNGDALVVVLTTGVPDTHLAELRRDGISYLFAGERELDLPLALRRLAAEFGIRHLLLEGGGSANGAFLEAGLVDEISLLVLPFADGARDSPTLFERAAAAAVQLRLQSVTQLAHDVLHLRYVV